MSTSQNYDLEILNHIAANPDTTQADLATRLGVAVGSVNWYIKRLMNKGYIKVTQMRRRRLRYLLTPQGLAEKARLTGEFMKASMKWYRQTRDDAKFYIKQVHQAGYESVYVDGDGDLSEIIYLTCLENGLPVREDLTESQPVFYIENLRMSVKWPDSSDKESNQHR